ncbi:MAG: hypothetical protein ACF8MF_11275 [Phycisphaerales bacterium JB052]
MTLTALSKPVCVALLVALASHSSTNAAAEPSTDFASAITQLQQNEQQLTATLYDAYRASIKSLGFNDLTTNALRQRLLLESDPTSLLQEVRLVDEIPEYHQRSGGDIEKTASLILNIWERFDEHAAANPRPTEAVYRNMVPPGGAYPSGISPADIREPEIRAAYEDMLRKNRANAVRLNRSIRAEQARKKCVSSIRRIALVLIQDLNPEERASLLTAIEDAALDGSEDLLIELRAMWP